MGVAFSFWIQQLALSGLCARFQDPTTLSQTYTSTTNCSVAISNNSTSLRHSFGIQALTTHCLGFRDLNTQHLVCAIAGSSHPHCVQVVSRLWDPAAHTVLSL
ncbi:hypothetical protein B0H10DRAFT_2023837, partial [Mycena sp. CBHHK59/15]